MTIIEKLQSLYWRWVRWNNVRKFGTPYHPDQPLYGNDELGGYLVPIEAQHDLKMLIKYKKSIVSKITLRMSAR